MQSKYFKQNELSGLGPGEYTLIEIIFYVVIGLNLGMLTYYPIFDLVYPYFRYIFMLALAGCFLLVGVVDMEDTHWVWVGLFFVLGALAITFNHSGYGLMIQFIWPLSIIYLLKYADMSDQYLDRLRIFFYISWVISVVSAYRISQTFFANQQMGIHTNNLNPNTVGIMITYTCLFLEAHLDGAGLTRSLKIPLVIISLAAVYVTHSRTCQAAFAAYLLMELLLKKTIMRSRKLAIIILCAVMIGGILFPVAYVQLFNAGVVTGDTEFMGKEAFSGRQGIWTNFWNYIQSNPISFLIGTGYNTSFYALNEGSFNLHNSYLQLFAIFGLPLLLMILGYIVTFVRNMYGNSGRISNVQFRCYQMILVIMTIAYTETILTYQLSMSLLALTLGICYREADGGRRRA